METDVLQTLLNAAPYMAGLMSLLYIIKKLHELVISVTDTYKSEFLETRKALNKHQLELSDLQRGVADLQEKLDEAESFIARLIKWVKSKDIQLPEELERRHG